MPPEPRRDTSSKASPAPVGLAGSFLTRMSTSRPTICVASEASESVGEAWPTTRPRRMTVMSSATARISRSLWVMNTMEVPASAS